MVVTLQQLPVIAQIHAKGVIHGDIHPGNILLTSTGPKLIDFGSSHFMENTGKTAFNYDDTYDHSLYFAGARRLASSTPTDCDDITSFSYMVVYIARGLRMPWDQRFWEITGRDLSLDMTLSELIAMKNSFSSSELCEGLPSLFESFLSAALGSITMNYDYNHWWNEFNKFAGKRTWSRPESS
ncbi:hypothetical protein EYR40_005952 [Pleurotus pulmonarius]|nr:hypothetical protein EYR36_005661 [Pleurotus pulmonarius]KAF4602735.1 hypothetical protein EYR40_005952 [Pleurotus pulmonarius]